MRIFSCKRKIYNWLAFAAVVFAAQTARADDLITLNNLPLILRARLAWAHDWVSNPALGATFQTLPGGAFTVNGAAVPADSVLASAGAQVFFRPNWSFEAKFEGEFAKTAQTYGGSGTLRYVW